MCQLVHWLVDGRAGGVVERVIHTWTDCEHSLEAKLSSLKVAAGLSVEDSWRTCLAC